MLRQAAEVSEGFGLIIRNIVIVGAGGIGQRHAQSCGTLPVAGYSLHLVDPNDENRARTNELLNGRDAVSWYKTVSDLPKTIDLAIVATRADIRAAITQNLVENASARSLILEKVLFQKLDDYASTGRILRQAGAAAWVNCPRRLWLSYRQLRDELKGQDIARIGMSGADWDIGCNAIHFIDLFAFLTGSAEVVVDEIRLGEVRPAKRSGMLHIEGEVIGHLTQANRGVPFRIASIPTHRGSQMVRIETSRGVIEIAESGSSMTVTRPDGTSVSHTIPFQSQLTAPTIEDIIETGRCGLASYDESRVLHETFVTALLAALERAGRLADRAVCPIT